MLEGSSSVCSVMAWNFKFSEAFDSGGGGSVGFFSFGGTQPGGQSLCLDIYADSLVAGNHFDSATCNSTGAQKFVLTPAGAPDTFTVSPAANPSLCLDIPGAQYSEGGAVHLAACSKSSTQQWTVAGGVLRSHGNPAYCLDVRAADPSSGALVDIAACNGTAAQKFTLFSY